MRPGDLLNLPDFTGRADTFRFLTAADRLITRGLRRGPVPAAERAALRREAKALWESRADPARIPLDEGGVLSRRQRDAVRAASAARFIALQRMGAGRHPDCD